MLRDADLFAAVDATWPAHSTHMVEGWTIRDGRGGGQRVSAASGSGDISVAEEAMAAIGQDKLFMIQGEQTELDAALADRGYVVKDIWAEGGIGPARLDVMRRATCDKTFVMGRIDARASAAAFVGASGGICMAHAVEVLKRERRRGVAERMMRAAAWWGLRQGARPAT